MNTQTQQVMFSANSDEWSTPDDLYQKLNAEFNFTLDPCSTDLNNKHMNHFTINDNGLEKSWDGEIVFMNPPYSAIKQWIQKAYNESKYSNATVVALIPSRTDTLYWNEYCMDGDICKEIRFIKGRLKFGSQKNSAPFPSAIIIFSPPEKLYPKISYMERK